MKFLDKYSNLKKYYISAGEYLVMVCLKPLTNFMEHLVNVKGTMELKSTVTISEKTEHQIPVEKTNYSGVNLVGQYSPSWVSASFYKMSEHPILKIRERISRGKGYGRSAIPVSICADSSISEETSEQLISLMERIEQEMKEDTEMKKTFTEESPIEVTVDTNSDEIFDQLEKEEY